MKRLFRRIQATISSRRLAIALGARDATMTYMLTTLGNISVMWSGINLILNTFIERNQKRLGVNLPRGLPINFTAKLNHLKKVEKDEIWTDCQREEMRNVRLTLASLNGTRKELFHGVVHMTGLSEAFVVHIAKEQGDELVRKSINRTYGELTAFRDELARTIDRLTALYNPILGFTDKR